MNYIPNESFAGVDLGSNSFHMIVANYSDGRLQIIDRIKEMVRLASGLDDRRCLDEASMDRAIQCLERFGQRIREIPRVNVRAVGTNTLRQARNGSAFLKSARRALGHPIEIIAGREEARLIFLGVAHSVYNETDKRLVVDIGGGSTELIIGRGFNPYYTESLYMGCVGVSERFFSGGEISAKRMRRAMLFARQELEGVEATYRKVGWDAAIGASGTILSINDALALHDWSSGAITSAGLSALREYLIAAGNVDKLEIQGLSDRRRPVFAGGVAILSAVFDALEIDRMTVSEGALREGLLYDLIGRVHNEDVRDKTIVDLTQRYGADVEQAKRVAAAAAALFNETRVPWKLNEITDRKLLDWAARVHEIGISIAHAQYHRHGAYVLTYSDLPGFSREDQVSLAVLVRLHRRKFQIQELEQLPEQDRDRMKHLCILLRLAVLLHRSRSYTALPHIQVGIEGEKLQLHFPEGWLKEHPLTLTDLETELELLSGTGVELEFA